MRILGIRQVNLLIKGPFVRFMHGVYFSAAAADSAALPTAVAAGLASGGGGPSALGAAAVLLSHRYWPSFIRLFRDFESDMRRYLLLLRKEEREAEARREVERVAAAARATARSEADGDSANDIEDVEDSAGVGDDGGAEDGGGGGGGEAAAVAGEAAVETTKRKQMEAAEAIALGALEASYDEKQLYAHAQRHSNPWLALSPVLTENNDRAFSGSLVWTGAAPTATRSRTTSSSSSSPSSPTSTPAPIRSCRRRGRAAPRIQGQLLACTTCHQPPKPRSAPFTYRRRARG